MATSSSVRSLWEGGRPSGVGIGQALKEDLPPRYSLKEELVDLNGVDSAGRGSLALLDALAEAHRETSKSQNAIAKGISVRMSPSFEAVYGHELLKGCVGIRVARAESATSAAGGLGQNPFRR